MSPQVEALHLLFKRHSTEIWPRFSGDNLNELAAFYYHINSRWQSLPAWTHARRNPIKTAFTHGWMPFPKEKKKCLRWHSYFCLWDSGSFEKAFVFSKRKRNKHNEEGNKCKVIKPWNYNYTWPKPVLLEFTIIAIQELYKYIKVEKQQKQTEPATEDWTFPKC